MTTLTASAHTDSVSVMVMDSTRVMVMDSTRHDTISIAQDSLPQTGKRNNWFWKAYYFLDGILSPKRDPRYIDVQKYNWCAMGQLSTKLEMYQMDSDEGNFMLRVAPQPHLRFGPFFGWRFLFLGYNIDLQSGFSSNGDIDLSGSVYSSAFGLDLFYRRVGGDFNISKLQYDNRDYTDYLHGQSYSGISLGMTRVSFYYVPNYKHYSHQAAFSQTNRQLLSAGSLLLGAQYAHNTCSIDWEGLTDMMKKYNPGLEIERLAKNGSQKNDEISLTVGYGYNWVFAKNFLLGTEIAGGLGYLIQHVQAETEDNKDSPFLEKIHDEWSKHVSMDATARLSLLYNNGPLFAGLQAVAFYYQHGNGTIMTRNLLATFYAMVGWNF